MQQAYNSATTDLTNDRASFEMIKNTSSSEVYSIETDFTPLARINFKIPIFNIANLSLYSASGKLLQTRNFSAGVYQLDLSAYPSGAYFVNLVIDSEVGHFKIVKL